MTTVTVNLIVDLSKVSEARFLAALAAFMKATNDAETMPTQKAIVTVDPETGFAKKDEWLTPERAAEIAEKLNSQAEAEKAGKVKKARKERAPLTPAEKNAIRVRMLTGKLNAAKTRGDKDAIKAAREALAAVQKVEVDTDEVAINMGTGKLVKVAKKTEAKDFKPETKADRKARIAAGEKVVEAVIVDGKEVFKTAEQKADEAIAKAKKNAKK